VDECWSGSFANLAVNLNVFDQDSEESRIAPSCLFWFQTEKEEEKW
jgi:hypothetical protein